MSRSASQTASADSSVQPPTKTASRAKSRCSSSSSSSWLHSIVARSVCWRGSTPRPALSRSSRCESRSTSCSGERTRTRAAASSSASGRFSSRAHSSGTASLATKLGLRCTRPRHEELRPVLRLERRDRIGLLAGNAKQLAARHEQMDVGAGGEQLGESGRCFDDVLEVVEQKQQRFVGQVLRQTVLGSERLPRRHQDELGVTQRRQRHPEDPVRVALPSLGGRLQPEPRLARPARARERQQAGVLQQPAHLGQLVLTTEERRRRNRQVRPVETLQRREVLVAELVDPLGRGEVLEPVLAEVPQPVGAEQRSRGRRDEHLPAVSCRRDPRRAVHVDADVPLLGHVRRARMDAHPHPDRARGQSLAARGSGRRSAPGAVGNATKKASPCVSTSTPPWAPNASRRMPAMLGERLRIRSGAQLVQQLVEPSTSVNRKVTVPEGRSRPTGFMIAHTPRGPLCVTRLVSARVTQPNPGTGLWGQVRGISGEIRDL